MTKYNTEMIKYIEESIIPIYSEFDKGHDIRHARKVINSSEIIAQSLDVNMDMVYVIASYHDLGIKLGRENHEKNSGTILFEDLNLRKWFTLEQVMIMKEAVEDHRASNKNEPRSIYGKIVAEADRDITYNTILYRTVQYSLESYPHYSFEEHFERIFHHIQDKYGEHGYLKLWLNTVENVNGLTEIRTALKNKEKIVDDCKKLMY